MKVSVNWLKKFTNIKIHSDELVEKIGSQLGAVESVENVKDKYEGILVVKVIVCEKHANADKLIVCQVDDGGVTKNVERGKDGLVQVVCGAPNVAAGRTVAWIPPGATVPSSADKDPFVIEAREIRGEMSNGMLASPSELAIGDGHEGLLLLEKGKPGQTLIDLLELDDQIIDIENKMFTHRPDCFGMVGIAREIAGITDQNFKSPDWYREETKLANDGRKNSVKLTVKNDLPKLVPRFCAVAIKDIQVGPSPAWVQTYLSRVGVRPINNVVDVTNLVMLETAQPLHAYDLDKLATNTLGIRKSKEGESLEVIGGKKINLNNETIVITDGDKPIGIGGIMGGASTQVDSSTKNIVLEVANFDMNTTRRASMALGLFTDASTRFTKNQSSRQNRTVLNRAVDLLTQIAGGRMCSEVIDDNQIKTSVNEVVLNLQFINDRLGKEFGAGEVKRLLENVEFKVNLSGNKFTITAPFWRTDIEIAEDIVEEVGRLYGYDNLKQVLPMRSLEPPKPNSLIDLKSNVRKYLVSAGANEVMTYSFVNGSLLQKVGQDTKKSFHIKNALSPELQYYRQSLMPSLLEKIHPNIKEGFDEFALFEIGRTHVKGILDKDGLPHEFEKLALIVAGKKSGTSAAFYRVKKYCQWLLSELGVRQAEFMPTNTKVDDYYEQGRSAVIKHGEEVIGVIGEYKSSVSAKLKLPEFCAGFELDLSNLVSLSKAKNYEPLNRFPALNQDICLKTDASLQYAELDNFIKSNLDNLAKSHGYRTELEPIDIFQKPSDKKSKQTTWRIYFAHPDRTLTTDEVNKALDELSAEAKSKLNAERI